MPVLDVREIAARLPTKYSGVAATASLLAHALVFLALQVSGAAVLGSPAMAQDQAPDATGGQPRGITAVVPRSWPPRYQVDDDGKPFGFAIDVMNEVAARAGLTVDYKIVENLPATGEILRRGEADIIPNIGILPRRFSEYLFTAPIEMFVVSLFVRNDNRRIAGLADLAGRKLAVVENNIGLFMFGERSDFEVRVHPDLKTALFDLLSGNSDALVYPRSVLEAFAKQLGIEDTIKVVGPPLRRVERGIGLMKGNTALLETLNQAVMDFIGTPEYRRIYTKWFGDPKPFWTVSRITWTMGVLVVAVLIVMALWRFHSVVRLNRDLRASIGKRDQAEAALRVSEARFRAIFEDAPMGIALWDRDGTLLESNSALSAMFGVEHDELVGQSIQSLTAQDDVARSMEHFRSLLSGGRNQVRFEKQFLRMTGEPFPARLASSVVRDQDGEFMFAMGMIEDISERKRAQEQLRVSEARFARILDIAGQAIISIDERRCIQLFNKRAEEIFGYAAEEILGRSIDILLPEQFRAAHHGYMEEFAHAADSSRVMARRGQITGQRKDGADFPAEASISKLEIGGEQIFTVMLSDVSERNEAEEKFRQAQKIEAIGQLTGGVAHDFNNILAVILGNAELLQEQITDEGGLVRQIVRAASRGAQLTHRLLAFSRRQPLQRKVVDVNVLIADMGDLLRRTLGETVTVTIAQCVDPCTVEIDPGQLESAILNVAINARDAMPKGGTLAIETTKVGLDQSDVDGQDGCSPGDYVRLAMTDTGIGMSADVIEHAFEPFFTTKDVGEGTGLGLSMIHGFVRQSGGFVGIDSAPGRGCSVRLFLPRVTVRTDAVGADETAPTRPLPPGGTVLVVEDDPDVRDLAIRFLADFGCSTVEAADGAAALRRLEENSDIDFLFTDVVLPHGLSGPEIARAARLIRPDLKIIFASGYPDKEIEQLAWDSHRPQIVTKPYTRAGLAEALSNASAPLPPPTIPAGG